MNAYKPPLKRERGPKGTKSPRDIIKGRITKTKMRSRQPHPQQPAIIIGVDEDFLAGVDASAVLLTATALLSVFFFFPRTRTKTITNTVNSAPLMTTPPTIIGKKRAVLSAALREFDVLDASRYSPHLGRRPSHRFRLTDPYRQSPLAIRHLVR